MTVLLPGADGTHHPTRYALDVDERARTVTWRSRRRRPMTFALPGGPANRPQVAASAVVAVLPAAAPYALRGQSGWSRNDAAAFLLLDPDGRTLVRSATRRHSRVAPDWAPVQAALAGLGVETLPDPAGRRLTPPQLQRLHPGTYTAWPLHDSTRIPFAFLLALVAVFALALAATVGTGGQRLVIGGIGLVALVAGLLFTVRPTRQTLEVARLRRAARR